MGTAATWLDVVTIRTIIADLQQSVATQPSVTTGTGPSDDQLLAAIARHVKEWDTNPIQGPGPEVPDRSPLPYGLCVLPKEEHERFSPVSAGRARLS